MDLDAALWWALRIAFPLVFVVRWRMFWIFPCFSLYLLAGAASAWMDDYYDWRGHLVFDTPVMAAKIGAAVEAICGLLWIEPPERRTWVLISFGALVMLGASLTMQAFGWGDAWINRRALRLMVHAGLAFALTFGIIYGRMTSMKAKHFVWRHVALLAALCWLHTITALGRDEFWTATAAFKFGLLALLLAWGTEALKDRKPVLKSLNPPVVSE